MPVLYPDSGSKVGDRLIAKVPLRRSGNPDEIAQAVPLPGIRHGVIRSRASQGAPGPER